MICLLVVMTSALFLTGLRSNKLHALLLTLDATLPQPDFNERDHVKAMLVKKHVRE